MTSIQKAQLEFLNETVAFYTSENRCINYSGVCFYHREGKAGCAIGRKIPVELAQELDNLNSSGVNNDYVFNKLPESLKELEQDFLKEIQGLHDEEANWDNQGLTEYGHNSVMTIKKAFGLIEN